MPRRRKLNGIVGAVASSFLSRNNDVDGYWALGKLYLHAKQQGVLQVSVTLAPLEMMPNIEPMASIARTHRKLLVSQMERQCLPASWLVSSSVTIEFESATAKPRFLGSHVGGRPFRCNTLLTDDRQRKHEVTVVGWCWPHDATRETQSVRAC